jgi:hypothetical protein
MPRAVTGLDSEAAWKRLQHLAGVDAKRPRLIMDVEACRWGMSSKMLPCCLRCSVTIDIAATSGHQTWRRPGGRLRCEATRWSGLPVTAPTQLRSPSGLAVDALSG